MRGLGGVAVVAAVGVGVLIAARRGGAQAAPRGATPPQPLYKFAIDYDVPESPGFAALGETPARVLRAGAAKPLVTSLLSQIATSGKLRSGVAIDVAPYFVYGGTVASVDDYATHPLKRVVANTQLSFATVQAPADTSSVSFWAGVRVTLLDAHDLLTHQDLLEGIFEALNHCASAPKPVDGAEPDADVTRKKCPGLAEAYATAKQAALKRPGWSAAIGAGMGGLLRGAVVSRDSLGDRRGRIWLSSGYTFGSGQELLLTAQGQDSVTQRWTFRGGAAAKAKFPSTQLALELVYDGSTHAVQPGGSVEWRALPGIWLVTALSSEGVAAVAGQSRSGSKLRLRTALRWNLASNGS